METVTLTFTQEQLQVLDTAIKDVPYRLAAPLVHEINMQIARQQQKPKNVDGIPDEIRSLPN